MKKRVTAELISIAHRILKLKNHSETVQLQQEAKNLYDQLTILRFYEENFELVKSEIPQEILEEKLEGKPTEIFNAPLPEDFVAVSEEKLHSEPIKEEKIVIAELIIEEDDAVEVEEEVVSSAIQEEPIEEEINQTEPIAEISKAEEPIVKQITFEDVFAQDYKEVDFVKVEDVPVEVEKAAAVVFEAVETNHQTPKFLEEEVKISQENITQEPKISSLNDRLNKTISFGLNDRIGFEKKLFGGSPDDFNRVISQLNTFDSFEEASGFIQDFVKPDYNNWEGCEDFEARFMEIVEKKFN
jgi:hypothetical protein